MLGQIVHRGALVVALITRVAHPLVAGQNVLLQIPNNCSPIVALLTREAHLFVLGQLVAIEIAR